MIFRSHRNLNYATRALAAVAMGLAFAPPFSRAETFRLEEASIEEIHAAMRAGALSAVELTSLYLNRIAVYDQSGVRINSIPQLNPSMLSEAAAADARFLADGQLGSLVGIPIVVKDSFNVTGLATTNGAAIFRDLIAPSDAFVVERLRAAGAVILGKANMSTLASGADGRSEAWGRTINPFDPAGNSGGSSCGSGAAVSANLSVLSFGGETWGSIRWPATWNAVVGLKPSRALISTEGTYPGGPLLDVIGPMGRSVADVARALDVAAGPNPDELLNQLVPPIATVTAESYSAGLNPRALAGKRIAVPRAYAGLDLVNFPKFFIDGEVAALFATAVEDLRRAGAEVIEVDFALSVDYDILSDATNPQWTRLGITAGYDAAAPNVGAYYRDQFIRSFNNPLLPDLPSVASRLNFTDGGNLVGSGNRVLDGRAKPYTEFPAVFEFFENMETLRRDVISAFKTTNDVDLFVFPSFRMPMAVRDEEYYVHWERLGNVQDDNAFIEQNFAGLPTVTVPMGLTSSPSPQGGAGLMFMGDNYGEAELLNYAHAYERASRRRTAPSLTPPLPGETIEYSTALPPPSRPELNAPALRVAGGAKVTGKGKKSALVINGGARDASGLSSLKVYVNGKKIAAKRAANWKASVKLSALRKFVRGDARTVSVQVVAKDIYGNTSVTTKSVKLPKEA